MTSLLPIGVGFLLGSVFVILLGHFDTKWAMAFFLLLGGGTFLLLLSIFEIKLPDVYLLSAAFMMPVLYDINFLYRDDPPFFVSANGFGITAADTLMILLMAQALIEGFLGRHRKKIRVEYQLPTSLLWFMAALLIINIISTFFVPYPFYAISMIWAQLKAYLVFYFIAMHLNSERTLQRLIYVLVAVMAIQGLIAIEQKFIGAIFTAERMGIAATLKSQLGSTIITRVSGTFGQPNALAMFINQLIVIAAFATLTEPRFYRKLLMAGGIGLAILAELFTASRGGWISLAFAFFVCFVLWQSKRGQSVFVSVATVGLGSVFSFGALFAASQSFRDRLLLDDHGTADVRQPLMDVAINMMKENPLTGVGLNHYTYYMAEYDRTMEAIASNYLYPVHNTFLLTLAETGVLSVIFFVSLLGVMIWTAFKVFQRSSGVIEVMSIGCLGGILSWCVHNQVDFGSLYQSYPLWLMFGVLMAMDKMTQAQKPIAKES
ncbi:MAG: O-antigen ligase family protein [Pontibacterium sp.]